MQAHGLNSFFFALNKRKMNREEEQQVINRLINANQAPRRVASGRTILPTGRQGGKNYLVLANGNELTSAGEYYYEKTNLQRPDRHFDPNHSTVKRGDGDYIQTSSGLRRVRQLGPDGQMQLTTLGKKFYKNKQEEYVVEIPVTITVKQQGETQGEEGRAPAGGGAERRAHLRLARNERASEDCSHQAECSATDRWAHLC
jgi:hypothetical protein